MPNDKIIAWCSWCLARASHEPAGSKRWGKRQDFRCAECGHYGVQCRLNCANLARSDDPHGARAGGGFVERMRRGWRNEFCAEHDGSIPSFGGRKLTDPELHAADTKMGRHWRTKVGGNFLRRPRTFELSRIQPGAGPEVIVVNGFLNEAERDVKEWIPALEALYPDNPWLLLRWEGKNLEDFLGVSRHDPIGTAVGAGAATAMGIKLGIIASALVTWPNAMHKAEQAGIALADIILRSDREFILCGHSLGARVIFYCLRVLSLHRQTQVIRVHLLGGAVGNHRIEWDDVKDATLRGIVNYHSRHDAVLKRIYETIGSAFTSAPIGCYPIPTTSHLLVNVDVSEVVSGHSHYKAHFAEYAARLGLE